MDLTTGRHTIFEAWEPDEFDTDSQYQKMIRAFSSSYISGDILDVGCGSRVFCDLTSASSWTGIDISPRMLSGIKFIDNVTNSQIVVGDVTDLQFKDNTFDTITCLFLLHHLGRSNKRLSHERVLKAFQQIHRVLRPGGKLIIAENCRGIMEEPYHAFYPLVYTLAKRISGVEMPYFWRSGQYQKFAKHTSFAKLGLIQIPITEWIYQPIFGFSVPPVFSHDLIQKMSVFVFQKNT